MRLLPPKGASQNIAVIVRELVSAIACFPHNGAYGFYGLFQSMTVSIGQWLRQRAIFAS